ncbi:hypothetical protein COLO4_15007 [Corchorus olitorius]|uniref:At1g61320/AtMIF1 LRR domain-containing protein n=1 Tax=Corchorus olitorius TaxID=93759 RepID=A0A1R3JPV8_9ROSI|nr:hypothetical protein COLO4_15007 [Corchorus olitorius]
MRLLSSRWRHFTPLEVFKLCLKYQKEKNLCFDCTSVFGDASTTSPFMKDDTKYYPRSNEFVTKVNEVLRYLALPVSKLQSFQVSFFLHDEYASYIDEWVNLAASKAVNKIDFKFSELYQLHPRVLHDHFYTFPWHVFSSNLNLEHLCLESCRLKPALVKCCLSSLKTLSLGCVPLEQDEFDNVLSAFSKLECLILNTCGMPKTFRIGSGHGEDRLHHLKSLEIYYYRWRSRDNTTRNRNIEIDGLLNLKAFQYIGHTNKFFFKGSFPSLVSVQFLMRSPDMDFIFDGLPTAVSHLQHLSIYLYSTHKMKVNAV